MGRRVMVVAVAVVVMPVRRLFVGIVAMRILVIFGSMSAVSAMIAMVVMIIVSVAIVMGLLLNGEWRRRVRLLGLRLGLAEGKGRLAFGRT
jgi:hypothetical protein